MGEVWAGLDQGERIYDLDKDFADNSAMTLTLNLETWFEVTAKTLPKDTLGKVKYEPDWAKGREYLTRTSDLRRSDWRDGGRTDWSLYGARRTGTLLS